MPGKLGSRALLMLMLLLPQRASAWGPEGHQIVAAIAQAHLNQRSLVELAQLLGPSGSLTRIANYADQYRSRCRNTGSWHYVDIPLAAQTYDAARDCPASGGGCVLSVLERDIGILKDRSQSLAERRFALRFIVHLVADVHQPLHAANEHDRGGNERKLRFAGVASNLHRLWDSDLMRATRRGRGWYVQATFALPEGAAQAMAGGRPVDWALEAHEVARRFVYGKLPASSDAGEALELGDPYLQAVAQALDTQLLRAGMRLARLLEDALTRPGPEVSADSIAQNHLCESAPASARHWPEHRTY